MIPDPEAPDFFAIFERSRNPMMLMDDDRWYVRVNQAACAFFGYTEAEMLSRRADDLTIVRYRPHMDGIWEAFKARGGSIGVFPMLRADGSEAEIEFNATASVLPGLHLVILINPVSLGPAEGLDDDPTGDQLMNEPVPAAAGPHDRLLDDDERTVMTLLALGQNWYDIAMDTETDVADVRALTQSSMAKLGARTRAHAVSVALRAGEITPGMPHDG